MGELAIEHVPIADLRPDPANPRRISDAEMEALTRSIREFGLVDPIIARREDRTVIGGHQRLIAARRLGLDAVPVVYVDLSPEQAKVLNLALNKISGAWDEELLARMLSELEPIEAIDLSLSGFSEDEIGKLLKSMDARERRDRPEEFDLDAAWEAATADPGVKRGDVFQLGPHRLMCGDSADTGDVSRLMAGQTATLMVTDPPYGVAYAPEGRRRKRPIANDALGEGQAAFWTTAFASWPLEGDAHPHRQSRHLTPAGVGPQRRRLHGRHAQVGHRLGPTGARSGWPVGSSSGWTCSSSTLASSRPGWTLQAQALALVARKLQSSLAVEGELAEEGLAAHGDEGEDLLLSLARSLMERVEASEDSLEGLFAGVRQTEHEVEAALRPDDLAPEEYEPELEPTPWSMPAREPADLTEFVDLPRFGSAAATAPSGNGASPEPAPTDSEPATPEPSAVTPAGRDGSDAEGTQGEQLRLL